MPQTILIADDELELRRSLTVILQSAFPVCTIITAGDGHEALHLAVSAKPALLILDMEMPGMSGPEVYIELKSAEATRGIKVLGISGGESREFQELLEKHKPDTFLLKPFGAKQLVDAVVRLMSCDAQ